MYVVCLRFSMRISFGGVMYFGDWHGVMRAHSHTVLLWLQGALPDLPPWPDIGAGLGGDPSVGAQACPGVRTRVRRLLTLDAHPNRCIQSGQQAHKRTEQTQQSIKGSTRVRSRFSLRSRPCGFPLSCPGPNFPFLPLPGLVDDAQLCAHYAHHIARFRLNFASVPVLFLFDCTL